MEETMPYIALAIGVVLAAIDQIIKYFIVTDLKPVGTVSVLGDVFKLTYVENRGVAFEIKKTRSPQRTGLFFKR